jgi:Flp pilus assembly protein TadD
MAVAPAGPRGLRPDEAQQAQHALRLLQSGNAIAALAVAVPLAARAPDAPDALQLLAMCHADANQPVEAERAFARALALAPAHPLVLGNFAGWLRRRGRHEDAFALFERAAAAAPQAARAWFDLGTTALELRRHDAARAALERAVALQPDHAGAWQALGAARRGLGELDGAEAALRRAVELAPGDGIAWVNLGAVQRLQGRSDEAIVSLQRAGAAGLAAPERRDALVGALLDEGRAAEALAEARALVRAAPDYVPGHVTLANLLWEYGPVLAPGEDALAALAAAAEARPQQAELQLALIGFLLTARDPAPALARIRALQARAPSPVLLALEADALHALGETAQAGERYAQAHAALGDADPAFLNAWARHLLAAGRPEEAALRATAATRTDPDNQEAWANLGTAWRLLGDAREAWLCDYERLAGVVAVEPPPGFADRDAFLAALEAALVPLHRAGREPARQSLRGGSQTSGRLFGRRDPVIAATQQALQHAVERWIATLPDDPTHPFLRRKAPRIRFSGSWSVRLWSSGRHANHIHNEGWMSSAFYVALPPSIGAATADGAQAGYLQFGQPPVEYGLALPARRVVRPEPGTLALFPSYFWHGTAPFTDTVPRLTVAFDMLPAR